MAADAIEERIEELAPKNVRSDAMPDLSGVIWKDEIGAHGPYQKCEADTANPAYSLLIRALGEHNGKMSVDGYFLWKFVDQSIGRKKLERR
jgi:hypothetical protein